MDALARIGPNGCRALWNTSPDAMVLTDAAGTVLAANPSFCALHGFLSRDLVGQNVTVTFPESTRFSAMDHYHTVFDSRDQGHAHPAALRWRDEAGRLLESRIDFITTRDDRTSSMMSSVRVVEEVPIAAAKSASGGPQVLNPEHEDESSSSQAHSSAERSSIPTPEIIVKAIQDLGVEIVLGIPDGSSGWPDDMVRPPSAGQTPITETCEAAVERLDRWEDDGGATVDGHPSLGRRRLQRGV
jgi:PAS domain S-box-containing protein